MKEREKWFYVLLLSIDTLSTIINAK